jgi:excinuclease ABC subunit C
LTQFTLTENQNKINLILPNLPESPGVYQFFDAMGKILYVGKAKNLKKRVSSYFQDKYTNGKTVVLVRKTEDIKYIIVSTELDALLLENNLIKVHQPRYNIQLRDDKTYPWICIKNEAFPRVFSTRNPVKDGSQYFGPYASVKMMNTLLDLARQLCSLRTCSYQLTQENINSKKFKVCLEYHIGNCKGPCVGDQPEEEYHASIQQIREILKGNISNVIKNCRQLMQLYAERLDFENAQIIKDKIALLERYQSKSLVVNPAIHNADVYSFIGDAEYGYVNFMKIMNGAIIQSHTIELKKKLDESPAELLSFALIELRQKFHSEAKEIFIPFEIELEIPDVEIIVPKIGDKKKLIELSERNVKYYMLEKHKQMVVMDPDRHSRRISDQMQKDLRMKELPIHIECFDNSNIQGAYPVSAMVVFKNTKPSKKDYRHFNIKTVEGPNDFASMEEVVFRRYKRMLDEGKSLPQLIVIDGGKGQLSAALNSLEKLGLRGKITIIGIAKKLEEIYFPGDSIPLYLDKKSETLKVIQHIRNEAHRFGITHHRKRREKGTIKTELSEIKGIGEKAAAKLLTTFHSVKGVKEASLAILEGIIGKAKARIVFEYFQ